MSEDSKVVEEKEPNPTDKEELPPIKYGEPDLCDVILTVEKQEFYVHKMALACRSKYFKTLFYVNFKEKDQDRIELKEVSRIAFRRLMDFMYFGKMTGTCPVFQKCRYVTNIGCGELKLVHDPAVDKEKHIREFWKNSSEMLELADRFDVRQHFYQYFQQMLDYSFCTTASCFVCVTIHIFGLVNDLYLGVNSFRKHDYNFIKEWLKHAEAAKIDQDGKLGFVCKLFNSKHNLEFIKEWSQLAESAFVPKDNRIEFLAKLLSTIGPDT